MSLRQLGELGDLPLVLGVDGVELLVDALELLVGALELLVRREQLLVRGLELLVARLELLDRRLQVLLRVAELLLEARRRARATAASMSISVRSGDRAALDARRLEGDEHADRARRPAPMRSMRDVVERVVAGHAVHALEHERRRVLQRALQRRR